MSKYKGIDERIIKCCDTETNTRESGISFDYNYDRKVNILRFHFLEYIAECKMVDQITRTMYLNKENTAQLIKALQELTFEE